MYNKNIKPIYNYDLKECNLLFKKGIHPIGCGIGDSDGRVIMFLWQIAILNGMYSNKYGHLSTFVNLIGYEMTGKFLKTSNKRERTIIDGIKSAVHSLIEKGVIEIINQDNDNYIFSDKGLEVNSGKKKFVVVEQWEMQSIFERANKPFNVFSFYCSLIGSAERSPLRRL